MQAAATGHLTGQPFHPMCYDFLL